MKEHDNAIVTFWQDTKLSKLYIVGQPVLRVRRS